MKAGIIQIHTMLCTPISPLEQESLHFIHNWMPTKRDFSTSKTSSYFSSFQDSSFQSVHSMNGGCRQVQRKHSAFISLTVVEMIDAVLC